MLPPAVTLRLAGAGEINPGIRESGRENVIVQTESIIARQSVE